MTSIISHRHLHYVKRLWQILLFVFCDTTPLQFQITRSVILIYKTRLSNYSVAEIGGTEVPVSQTTAE